MSEGPLVGVLFELREAECPCLVSEGGFSSSESSVHPARSWKPSLLPGRFSERGRIPMVAPEEKAIPAP